MYGGIINRANKWLSSPDVSAAAAAAAAGDTATEAAAAANSSISHVAMSFESPDPLISRVFLAAAQQAAGAFDLFLCCRCVRACVRVVKLRCHVSMMLLLLMTMMVTIGAMYQP